MLWKTHIRISKQVMDELRISLTDLEFSKLKDGVIAPDQWKDYPHHYGKDDAICNYLNLARSHFLKGDKLNAYYNLGVAFHYIQDSYTTYPSFLPKHQQWEEWIENCHYVHDLHGAIQTSVKNKLVARSCAQKAEELFKGASGRGETLRLATMNGQKKDEHSIASPKADFNLGLLASYVAAKSVLGPTRNPALDVALASNLEQHVGHMKMAENESLDTIKDLVSKRNEQAKKIVPPNGVMAKLKNWLTRRRLNHLENRLLRSKQDHFQREHLKAVANRYEREAGNITAEHVGWYEFTIPSIDIGVVINELVEVQGASDALKLDQQKLKDLLIEHSAPIYDIGDSFVVERSILDKIIGQNPINGFNKLPI